MGNPCDHVASQRGPYDAQDPAQSNGHTEASNSSITEQCNGQGNHRHLHVLQHMQQFMTAQALLNKGVASQLHNNAAYTHILPPYSNQPSAVSNFKQAAQAGHALPLHSPPVASMPHSQSAQYSSSATYHNGFEYKSPENSTHIDSAFAPAQQDRNQQHEARPGWSPVGVGTSGQLTSSAQHFLAPPRGHHLSQGPAHTHAAQIPGVAPAAPQGAAAAGQTTQPVRTNKISIRIKAVPRDGTPTSAASQVPAEGPHSQHIGASRTATASPCGGCTPAPVAKRKGRSKGTPVGKKQKALTAHNYLKQAQKLVKGSCARMVLMAQHNLARSQAEEEGDDTLRSLARSHNIQCHCDAVDRGGAVAQVSDPQTIKADQWRRQCKSMSRFDEAQAGAAQRTSGRSRKSTKPQLQRGKVAASMCTQIQEAAAQQQRFVVRPSHIAGIGVYTKETLPAKQILLEYQGITVRRVHADRLEASYEKAGKDHYLFAVDQSEFIVDATNQGGIARFVNHSCGPNCEVRTVSAEGVRRVVLVSLREIRVGEELSYDYRLNPDPDKAIRCRCRSKRCRGWL